MRMVDLADGAPVTVRHAPELHRYEAVLDGDVVGAAEYRPMPDHVVMHHTFTDTAFRGRGIAALVVAGALDDLRIRKLGVVPSCWYVAEFIESHPEYRNLLHSS